MYKHRTMQNTRRETEGDETLAVVEICVGAGGQALGLEGAGFDMVAAIDNDPASCETLRLNRPSWTVLERDVRDVSGRDYRGIDLLAGGVPCPPFSIAGDQLGHRDDRDLFPEALRLAREIQPRAVLLENVRGLANGRFASYRDSLISELVRLGYRTDWRILNASSFGVPQLRPRFLIVALRDPDIDYFHWPEPLSEDPRTVGETVGDLMGSRGWRGTLKWIQKANSIAPTLVGGSKKHGGPDLGPTRARREWAKLGVDGLGIADEPPGPNEPIRHIPRLTVRMAARLQGFPDSWIFSGRKTQAYRQVGNAFPPPVAEAIGRSIHMALQRSDALQQETKTNIIELTYAKKT